VLFVFIKKLIKTAHTIMNLKRTFGAILTVLGIIGLIYAGIGVINHSSQVTTLIVVAIIAILFFFTGISLVRNTKDEA
jgi:uncharacterized membrane protein